ncbi:restriction endonuclease subunit S [Vibrio alginolyticus]|uniref:restriction endonuclease subunit S n=1 Tax=Vibrio alginolyticus TaxID=663 RepID=UPI001BD26F8A|nr:restriction endonuclease subunit S [Vibrio alginolyticus]MBT0095964.1 restriction endonuclease subunit S [Vibrio alginolyticus]
MSRQSLPNGWSLASYCDVFLSASNGVGGKQNKDGNGIPVSRIETIAEERIDYDRVGFLANYDKSKVEKHLLLEGDILFSHINSPTHLGKTAIYTGEQVLYHGINLLRIVVNRKLVLPQLFNYHCKYIRALGEFSSRAQHAVNQSSLNQKKLGEFEFPLPPLAEQKIIAEKLDTLLAQVETTKARLESTLETLKQFRQSVLAAAVSGKLTTDWIGEREAWGKYALSELCRSVSDGDHQAPPRSDEGIPFLVISNVSDGVINFNTVTRWVPLDYYESLKSIRKPEKRDILYTVTGSFGIPVIVDTSKAFCFQRHIAIIKPNHDKVNYKYLTLYLSSIEALRKAESVATGTAQKTVSLTNLRKFVIPLPSREEQEEIVKRVEKILAGADATEQQVNQALERVNNLTQSILAKAFRGELTEQWRKENSDLISGDNSAEALLKKIKAERAAAKPKSKSKK